MSTAKIKSLKKLKIKPWEMTPYEFFLTREDVPEAAKSGYWKPTEAEIKSASQEHQDVIIRAMAGGKDVPPRAYRHLSKAKIEGLIKSEKERRKKGGQNWKTIIANYWKGNPEAAKKIHAKGLELVPGLRLQDRIDAVANWQAGSLEKFKTEAKKEGRITLTKATKTKTTKTKANGQAKTALSKLRKCDLVKYIRRNATTEKEKQIQRSGQLKPIEIADCNLYRLKKEQLLNKAYRLNGNGQIKAKPAAKKRVKVENCTKNACFGEGSRYLHPSVAEGKRSEFSTRYKLIEAKEALTSHMPEQGFKERPNYPTGIQDRDYANRKGEDQIAVLRNAKNLEPAYILVRSVSASEGSPIVDQQNFVLSGNSRAMSIFEASRNHPQKYQNYKNELYNRASEFGLTKPAIDRFKNPILVREITLPTKKEKAIFASNANKPISRSLDSIGKSLELAKVLESQADIASVIALQEGQTLRQFLTTVKGKQFVDFLYFNTSPTERGAYFKRGGQLSEVGKTVLEDAIFATVFDDRKTLESMSASLRRALESSLPELIRLQQARLTGQIEADDNLIESLKHAIDFFASNPSFSENPDDWARQTAIIPKSSLGLGLDRQAVDLLTQFGNKPRALRDRIAKYLKSVTSQRAEAAMFKTEMQPGQEILQRLIQSAGGQTEGALFGLRKRKPKRRAKRK
jgi:hypothetical protein